MAQPEIAGPPTWADAPRVGFPWTVPLTMEPSSDWAGRFNAVEWDALASEFRGPYFPRLDGQVIWFPGVPSENLPRLLDVVASKIEEISRLTEEAEAAFAAQQADAQEKADEFRGAGERAVAEWWRSRKGG